MAKVSYRLERCEDCSYEELKRYVWTNDEMILDSLYASPLHCRCPVINVIKTTNESERSDHAL